MAKQVTETARGILNPHLGQQKFELARYEPSPALAPFVEHYWTVKWDLRGDAPYRSETLPYPSVHLTVEPARAHLVGVVTRKFSRLLEDEGWVFGIKFRPGGVYPFVRRSVAEFTDGEVPLAHLFGERGAHYAHAQRTATSDAERVAIAEEFLHSFAPVSDDALAQVAALVDAIMHDRAITKVDHLVARFQRNKRALQRLFQERVGVSPKWVIQRYRLHEATEQAAAGDVVDWSKLAVELGYFDQAHFIKDFKGLVGKTPAEYAKQVEASPTESDSAQSSADGNVV
jgi:AraC-like DNA-binding protein